MIVCRQMDGSWTATGMGPLRVILAEGGTRREAVFGWAVVWREQKLKVMA